MTTITKEHAQKIIDAADKVITALAGTNDDFHPNNSEKMCGLWDDLNDRYAPPEVVRELARAMLASMDAEPVRYLNKFSGTCVTLEQQSNAADDVAVYIPLYAAPPAPVVPEDLRRSFEAVARLNNEMYRWTSCMSYNGSYVGEPEGLLKRNIREIEHIMDSCRASMLNVERS